MNRRLWLRASARGAVGATVASTVGGSSAAAASTDAMAEDLLISWRDIARKLFEMADDFPEDKYDWKPASDVRSFAEQLVHAAGFIKFVAANAEGRNPPEAEPRRSDFPSKAAIVAFVKQTYAEGERAIRALTGDQLQSTIRAGLRSRPAASLYGLWDTVVEHSGEHYGQLVLYYRLNKMTPPESRPRK
jgi:hypothetical protein